MKSETNINYKVISILVLWIYIMSLLEIKHTEKNNTKWCGYETKDENWIISNSEKSEISLNR